MAEPGAERGKYDFPASRVPGAPEAEYRGRGQSTGDGGDGTGDGGDGRARRRAGQVRFPGQGSPRAFSIGTAMTSLAARQQSQARRHAMDRWHHAPRHLPDHRRGSPWSPPRRGSPGPRRKTARGPSHRSSARVRTLSTSSMAARAASSRRTPKAASSRLTPKAASSHYPLGRLVRLEFIKARPRPQEEPPGLPGDLAGGTAAA